MKNKGFATIIIILLLVLVGVIGFLGYMIFFKSSVEPFNPSATPIPSQTTDPTEDWKEVSNSLGFSFKYPTNKFTDCGSNKDGIQLWDAPFDCPSAHDIFYRIGALIYKLGEYKPDRSPTSSEYVVIDGVKTRKNTYKYTVDDGPAYPYKEYTEVVIDLSNSTLRVQLLGDSAENKKLFDQILSTLKFIDLSTTADWKTYSNSSRGFSLKYPPYYVLEEVKGLGANTQQEIFRAESGDVRISSFNVYSLPAELPEYPYDQKPTGKYTLDDTEGIYVELPNGSGDGGMNKGISQVAVFANKNGILYRIDIYGSSEIKDPTVSKILSSFKFIQ